MQEYLTLLPFYAQPNPITTVWKTCTWSAANGLAVENEVLHLPVPLTTGALPRQSRDVHPKIGSNGMLRLVPSTSPEEDEVISCSSTPHMSQALKKKTWSRARGPCVIWQHMATKKPWLDGWPDSCAKGKREEFRWSMKWLVHLMVIIVYQH